MLKTAGFKGLGLLLTLVTLLATLGPAVPPTSVSAALRIIYVNHAATGGNHGGTWQNAYTSLHNALEAAKTGDQVWVAAGLYKPSVPTPLAEPRKATFNLKDGVAVYGGFLGNETSLAQRDWLNNLTMLSGDIDHNDLTDADGVVHTWEDIKGANAYNVVTAQDVGPDTILDGFVITGGKADLYPDYRSGGGIYLKKGSSDPVLRNLIISGNYALRSGGGLFAEYSWPRMEGILFQGNYSVDRGGGMAIELGQGTSILKNVIFHGNASGVYGGGLWYDGSESHLENVLFSGNTSYNGGGMNINSASPKLYNVTFSGNTAEMGGGLSIGLYCEDIQIHNAILWGNHATGSSGEHEIRTDSGNYPSISNSLIRGSNGSGPTWNPNLGIDGSGNIDADPHFFQPVSYTEAPTTAGNYRLRAYSPAVDAGDSTVVTTTSDLDGNPRIAGAAVDMGAYEWQGTSKQINPAIGGTLTYTDASLGITTTVAVPHKAVTQPIILAYTAHPNPHFPNPPGTLFAGLVFDLDAFKTQDLSLLPGFAFLKPVTITIDYGSSPGTVNLEETLILYYLDGSSWRDVSTTCDPPSDYIRDFDAKTLSVDICHLTHFALFGEAANSVFLPLVMR